MEERHVEKPKSGDNAAGLSGNEVNQILLRDCMEFMPGMGNRSVDLIVTDIPYGEVSKNGAEREKYRGQLRNINKGAADAPTFNLLDFIGECARIVKGSIYIFCGIGQVSQIYEFFDNQNDFMVRQCGWRKTNPSPMNGQHMWESTIENCIFAKRRKTKFYAVCRPAIWDYPVERNKLHPTQKPLGLMEELILASSDIGDLVFDPCMGSGTTAVAAVNTQRDFLGCEISSEYCETANKRAKAAL